MDCLFCQSNGPFNTVEHIVPESLGNDELLLRDQLCDSCQRYFGKEVEQYVLNKSPLAFWRVFLGIRTKKGKHPKADLFQPKDQRGALPRTHSSHDGFAIEATEDGRVEITNIDPAILEAIESGSKTDLKLVFTPLSLSMLGRFLCKVGIELVCLSDPLDARNPRFDQAKRFARHGNTNQTWPILYHQSGTIDRLASPVTGSTDEINVECFTYWLGDVGPHRVFEFGMGIDRFTIGLDDPVLAVLLESEKAQKTCKLLYYKWGGSK